MLRVAEPACVCTGAGAGKEVGKRRKLQRGLVSKTLTKVDKGLVPKENERGGQRPERAPIPFGAISIEVDVVYSLTGCHFGATWVEVSRPMLDTNYHKPIEGEGSRIMQLAGNSAFNEQRFRGRERRAKRVKW